jgi:hypothetical protein
VTVDQIRLIDTTADAVALLNELAESHDWVSVFWDRGWGDHGQTAEISIIVDGNGQKPHAHLTPAVYQALVADKVVGENTLMTYKARRVHDFKTPPVEEKTGPTSNDVVEQVLRDILNDHTEKPIRVRFYRGLERGTYGPRVVEEVVQTPAAEDGWFVLLIPGHSDVAISAQKPSMFGADIIGGGVAGCLSYPKDAEGEPDLEALAGLEFGRKLLAAIDEKIAVIEAARA